MSVYEILDATNSAVTVEDEFAFRTITFVELSREQINSIAVPDCTFSDVFDVLAIHWHPEYIPLDYISKRVTALYPNLRNSLIIPTQHNCLMSYGDFTGVEVDCFSASFNQKVQLLLHLTNEKTNKTGKLSEMLHQTYQYRATQLHDIITTIVKPISHRISIAATETGADRDTIDFVRAHIAKVKTLIERLGSEIPSDMLKNKLLRDFIDTKRTKYGDSLINRGQAFLKAVKTIVKDEFPPQHFFRTEEIIEEARAIGCGIVVPHPEQFWPILLADYDIDGFEVWNPQSRKYTDFLISVVMERNSHIPSGKRKLIVFMGDDTHLGEKVKAKQLQDPLKTGREIGFQPAWDDTVIRERLIKANISKLKVIEEYRARLTE